MIVTQQVDDVADEGAAGDNVDDVPTTSVNADDVPAVDADAEPSIPSPPPTTQSPLPSPEQEQHYTSQGEIIANMDADEDVTLTDVAAVEKDDEVKQDADVQGRTSESQTQIYQIDLEHVDKLLSMQDDESEPAELKEVGVVIRDPKETNTPSTIIHTEPKSKDKGKRIMVQEPKPLKKKTQIEQDEAYARELETKAQARKNMLIYLRNMAGFKMDYFKGMSYDDIHRIFEKHFNSNVAFLEKTKEQMEEEDNRTLKRKVKSSEEKVDNMQKLDEEVEELRKHLQIVPNDDDDVYT
nr:hypothetical protein [Tanacetum cinerariifolium]